MSAVRREQPIRLPSDRGMLGALVTDASVEDLQACLAADRRWLHGGTVTIDDVTTEVLGFLTDASQNPKRYETVEEYLRHADERSANYRAVRRVALRIQAVEAEIAARAEREHVESAQRRGDARARLSAFVSSVPATVEAYQRRAREVADAWRLIEPIASALALLQGSSANANSNLASRYADLARRARDAASAVGAPEPDLPPLPDGLPAHDEIRLASYALCTSEWADDSLPATGVERLQVDRLVREARS